MTGTGSQADPYIPDDYDELVEAAAEDEVYIRLPAGALWDLNDLYPEGVPTILLRCNEIDGNGAELRNIRAHIPIFQLGRYISHDIMIKNMTIINVYITSTQFINVIGDYRRTLRLINDRFAVELYGESSFIYNDYFSIYSDRSSFRCHFSGTSVFNGRYGYPDLENCRIQFSGKTAAESLMPYARLLSCAILGSIEGTNTSIVFSGDSDASYIDCDFSGISEITYDGDNPFVINSDKIGTAAVSNKFIQADDAHIKDASWLRAHRFPIYSGGS